MKVECPNCGRKTFSFWRKYYVGTKYSITRNLIGHAPCFDCKAKLVYPTEIYYFFSILTTVFVYISFIWGIKIISLLLPSGVSYGLFLIFGWLLFLGIGSSYLLYYFMPLVVFEET